MHQISYNWLGGWSHTLQNVMGLGKNLSKGPQIPSHSFFQNLRAIFARNCVEIYKKHSLPKIREMYASKLKWLTYTM